MICPAGFSTLLGVISKASEIRQPVKYSVSQKGLRSRVLEIPTPRWTAYDAKLFNLNPGPDVTMITQERAYTSPIWYNPEQ